MKKLLFPLLALLIYSSKILSQNLEWNFQHGAHGEATAILPSDNGEWFVGGTVPGPYLIHLNKDGDKIWDTDPLAPYIDDWLEPYSEIFYQWRSTMGKQNY